MVLREQDLALSDAAVLAAGCLLARVLTVLRQQALALLEDCNHRILLSWQAGSWLLADHNANGIWKTAIIGSCCPGKLAAGWP